MTELHGKTLIFSDLHCGLAGNKISRLNICSQVIHSIVKAVSEKKISNIIFGGDWFHQRSQLDGNTINIALGLVEMLADVCPVYMCVGNHDAYFKTSVDINSINMFKSMRNINIIDKPTQISINGNICLLAPWLTDFSVYNKNQFQLAIGHFDISSKYLTRQYIAEHAASEAADQKTLNEIGIDIQSVNDSVGDFVETVKPNGIIFAGHIHTRREFTTKHRKFIFVGSPYQQNFGEMDNECGVYILNEDLTYEFVSINETPKHVKVLMSDALSGKFDFKTVHNAIIQRVYDIDISRQDESKIQMRIDEQQPYEEIVPEYIVKPNAEISDENSTFSVTVIRKSKLDYIQGYINSIDQKILDAKQLNKEKLFEILKNYYESITKEQ